MKKLLGVLAGVCAAISVFTFAGCFSACGDLADHDDGKCDYCFSADADTHVGKYEICFSCLWMIGTSEDD